MKTVYDGTMPDGWSKMDITIGTGDTLELTTNSGQVMRVVGITKVKTSCFWMAMGASGVVFGLWLARVM